MKYVNIIKILKIIAIILVILFIGIIVLFDKYELMYKNREFDINASPAKNFLNYIVSINDSIDIFSVDNIVLNNSYNISIKFKSNAQCDPNVINIIINSANKYFYEHTTDILSNKNISLSFVASSGKELLSVCNYINPDQIVNIGGFYNIVSVDSSYCEISELSLFSEIQYVEYYYYKKSENILKDINDISLPKNIMEVVIHFIRPNDELNIYNVKEAMENKIINTEIIIEEESEEKILKCKFNYKKVFGVICNL